MALPLALLAVWANETNYRAARNPTLAPPDSIHVVVLRQQIVCVILPFQALKTILQMLHRDKIPALLKA